jgi:hypothetical protein
VPLHSVADPVDLNEIDTVADESHRRNLPPAVLAGV